MRIEVLAVDPADVVTGHVRHDQHPDARRLVGVGDAADPRRLGRHVVRELLEVLGGHRPAAGAEQQRTPRLGVVEGLRLGPADGGRPVLHPGHVRDARS